LPRRLTLHWLAVAHALAGCAAPAPAPPPLQATAATVAPAAPAPPEPWPTGPGCRAILAGVAGLPAGARRRLPPETAPLALQVLDGGRPLPAVAASEAVRPDLPVPLDVGGAAPCLLLVERPLSARAEPRRRLAHEVVRSSYRRGSRSAANPEHAQLRRAVRELEDGDRADILATGDPGLDLIGLLAGGVLDGIDRFRRGRAAEQARDALAAMPARLEEPVWEPYSYEVTRIEATREGWLRAALVDRRADRAWVVERAVRETRRFDVATGRSAKDRALLEGPDDAVATAADVAVWEQVGLQPSLSGLVELLAAVPGDGTALDPVGIAAAWAGAPVRPAETPAGIVDALPDQALPDLDDAAGAAPPRASAVEQVVTADGVRRYRLADPVSP